MPKVIKETVFMDCPIRNVLARISGKWSLLVLYALDRNGLSPMRFNQLRRAIPDISQKVLTLPCALSKPTDSSAGRCLRRCLREWSIRSPKGH